MKKIVVTGKTVQEAINLGLSELNVTIDRVNVLVIDQPTKGFIGIGTKDAKVELELITNPTLECIEFMKGMFKVLDVEIYVQEDISIDGPTLILKGNNTNMFIGKKGQTLDALQTIVNTVANQHSTTHIRFILDSENFRYKRKRYLERLATDTASQVIKTNRDIVLEPMSASERKIIHYELQDHPIVKTHSIGEDPNRCIVISLI